MWRLIDLWEEGELVKWSNNIIPKTDTQSRLMPIFSGLYSSDHSPRPERSSYSKSVHVEIKWSNQPDQMDENLFSLRMVNGREWNG